MDSRGAARLTADIASHSIFGPSPGRYSEGNHEVTQTTELIHVAMTGTATRVLNAVEIHFTSSLRASVRFSGYGTLPLPPETTLAVDATLRCDLARVDVLPAIQAEGEQPTPMTLLRCAFVAVPEPYVRFNAVALVFGQGVGVRAVTTHTMWDHEDVRGVRRVP